MLDPGVSLGYIRHGLLPHPRQVLQGERVRRDITAALRTATDIVFSHYHGDHIPLQHANPYQFSVADIPELGFDIRLWSKSTTDLNERMRQRALDLGRALNGKMHMAEGEHHGLLQFSPAVPHGISGSFLGTVMMTRIAMRTNVFVHASDIQLFDPATIDFIIDWEPDIVLAAGPPLYIDNISTELRESAWRNAVKLASHVKTLILDHHLLRDKQGESWLEDLCRAVGKRVYCAADFMQRKRLLLEACRGALYTAEPVPQNWHHLYAQGLVSTQDFVREV